MPRTLLLLSILTCSVMSGAAHAQTAEETVGFILGIEDGDQIKLVSTSPAVFETKERSNGSATSSTTIKSIDGCRFVVSGVTNSFPGRMLSSTTYDFSSVAAIGPPVQLPLFKGMQWFASAPGLKASSCTGSLELLGDVPPKDRERLTTELARTSKEMATVSAQLCSAINQNGIPANNPYPLERANRALAYLRANSCKGRAF